ncbi:hypothetical protein [Hydrogenophaga sp. OTU3427]|uniref:hypothetical protein n=1 Tax=Hydrogenophaga sp. OTU3427 TaxID=3043856 RepID=UPI00313E3F40
MTAPSGYASVGQGKTTGQDQRDAVRAAHYENRTEVRNRTVRDAFEAGGPENFRRANARVQARRGLAMARHTNSSSAASGHPVGLETQKAHVLARLREYGPAFDHQLQRECYVEVPNPAAVIESLVADGYCFETLRVYRQAHPNAPVHEANLRVMFVRQLESGEVVPTPVLPGAGATDELWRVTAAPVVGVSQ